METKIPPPTTDKNATIITSGTRKTSRKRLSRRMLLSIIVVIIIVLGIAGYFVYMRVTAPPAVNENSETVIDVSSQMDDANEYPQGSYMWATIMLNAATYAASNGACKQANDIISQVENTKLEEQVDISAARNQVGESCG